MVLIVTSCGGDDTAPTSAAAPSTTGATTTEAAPTTTATTVSSSMSTNGLATDPTTPTTESTVIPTTPSTTESTVTQIAPSSTAEPVDERFAVIEAVEAATDASLAVLRNPFDDDKVAALENHFSGGQLTGWRNVVDRYQDGNQKQIENADEPDAFIISLPSIAVSVDGTSATVQGCEITSGIIVEIEGNPDGSDRVIEDGIARGVTELILTKVNQTWKVEEAREPTAEEGIASCP